MLEGLVGKANEVISERGMENAVNLFAVIGALTAGQYTYRLGCKLVCMMGDKKEASK